MNKQIYDFNEYKAYLLYRTGPSGTRTGLRSAIAAATGCNTAYVSQVLNGSSDFSLEQAEKINHLLDHTEEETHFFLLLVQQDRAGTKYLKKYFENQIIKFKEQRLNIQKRLGVKKTLSSNDQAIYYSNWQYGAVHVALSVPELRRAENLATYFDLPVSRIKKILDFLVSVGLAKENQKGFEIGESHIHLAKESENILRHHANWRLKAIELLDRELENDIHYASVFTISKKDAFRLKDMIIENLKVMNKDIEKSKEEEVYCFTTDFFRLGKN
jgi:uncharacterized protein (TIGR02147 family)